MNDGNLSNDCCTAGRQDDGIHQAGIRIFLGCRLALVVCLEYDADDRRSR